MKKIFIVKYHGNTYAAEGVAELMQLIGVIVKMTGIEIHGMFSYQYHANFIDYNETDIDRLSESVEEFAIILKGYHPNIRVKVFHTQSWK